MSVNKPRSCDVENDIEMVPNLGAYVSFIEKLVDAFL